MDQRVRKTGMPKPSALPAGETLTAAEELVVLIVGDSDRLLPSLGPYCDFFRVRMLTAAADEDLPLVLRAERPIAVVGEIDGDVEEGCVLLTAVASYDPTLPLLMILRAGGRMMAAMETARQALRIRHLLTSTSLPMQGDLVSFLATAIMRSGRANFMPV